MYNLIYCFDNEKEKKKSSCLILNYINEYNHNFLKPHTYINYKIVKL